ncbi:hypothetical protein KEM54_006589, partial [Ascosphaera aggregata]
MRACEELEGKILPEMVKRLTARCRTFPASVKRIDMKKDHQLIRWTSEWQRDLVLFAFNLES